MRKHILTKLTLALVAVGICPAAMAGGENLIKSTDVPVVVKYHDAGHFIGGSLLVFWDRNDDLAYSVTGNKTTGQHHFNVIDPGVEVGFRLEAGINLANSANDITVNWTRSYSSDSETAFPFNGKLSPRFGVDDDYDTVTGKSKFNVNEVNIEFGKQVQIDKTNTRLHVGLTFARVKSELDINPTDSEADTATVSATTDSRFWGVGLRAGVDCAYPLMNHLDLVSKVSASILAGNLKSKGNEVQVKDETGSIESLSTTSDDHSTIVPAGAVSLALRWTSEHQEGNGYVTIDTGVEATGYYHVILRQPRVIEDDENQINHFMTNVSNYGRADYFLEARWYT